MASRMEKFHGETVTPKRVDRNKNLYKTIYGEESYTNIEGIVETGKNNTVNIDTLKEQKKFGLQASVESCLTNTLSKG